MNKTLISLLVFSTIYMAGCDDNKVNKKAEPEAVVVQENTTANEDIPSEKVEDTSHENIEKQEPYPSDTVEHSDENDTKQSESTQTEEAVSNDAVTTDDQVNKKAEPEAVVVQENTIANEDIPSEKVEDTSHENIEKQQPSPSDTVEHSDEDDTKQSESTQTEEVVSNDAVTTQEDDKRIPGKQGNAPILLPLRYLEGRDYHPLAEVIEQVEAPKIIEFFWYGCPHCYDIHEPLNTWIKKDKSEAVKFETVPAMPSERWEIGGHLYYTAKALNLDINDIVFNQVHQQHNNGIILDKDKAKSFLVSQGVDKDKVEKAWKSFAVQQEIARAKKLFINSGLNGVPSFVVNGAYEVPFQGNYEDFFPKLEVLAQSRQTQ